MGVCLKKKKVEEMMISYHHIKCLSRIEKT